MIKRFFGSKSNDDFIDMVQHEENYTEYNYYHVSSTITNEIIQLIQTNLEEEKLSIGSIPEKKLSNVLKIYNIDRKKVLALYDTTVFKSGKDGLIVTDNFIGMKHAFSNASIIPFQDLVIGGIGKSNKSLYINNEKVELKTTEFTTFLQQLKELLLSKDAYLKEQYEQYMMTELKEIEMKIKDGLIDEIESRFNLIKNTVLQTSKSFMASVYQFGALIKMNQLYFDEAYGYIRNLETLNEWDNEKIVELKSLVEKQEALHAFDQLEIQKNDYLENHQYDEALAIVNEQKELAIQEEVQIKREIYRIVSLKQDFIETIEELIATNLQKEMYEDVFVSLKILEELNPGANYEEFEISARIGLYEFSEAEQQINQMENKQTAEKLAENLQSLKVQVIDKINKAVKSKDYAFFNKHPHLIDFKDKWGMTPLMQFIVQKDIDGVKLLAKHHKENDQNILGHTALQLVSLDQSNDFLLEAYMLLDDKLIQMMKVLKSSTTKGKFGKAAIKGIDFINGKALLNFSLAELTDNLESDMQRKMEQMQNEIEAYLVELVTKNYAEFIAICKNPIDYKGRFAELVAQKELLEIELASLNEQASPTKAKLDAEIETEIKQKMESFLVNAAKIELGEKDEFETTGEYENRIDVKVNALRMNPNENMHIQEQINNLNDYVTKRVSKELEDIHKKIALIKNKIVVIDKNITEEQSLVTNQSQINPNDVLIHYYESYLKELEIAMYDADQETFVIFLDKINITVKVPRAIAKNFKEEFDQLKPSYELHEQEDGKSIEHYFVYHFMDEKIIVPFLTTKLD